MAWHAHQSIPILMWPGKTSTASPNFRSTAKEHLIYSTIIQCVCHIPAACQSSTEFLHTRKVGPQTRHQTHKMWHITQNFGDRWENTGKLGPIAITLLNFSTTNLYFYGIISMSLVPLFADQRKTRQHSTQSYINQHVKKERESVCERERESECEGEERNIWQTSLTPLVTDRMVMYS